MLVVSVDQPWRRVLGFVDYYSGNHILYAALSKVIIKATGHHAIELMYRVPALIAAFLTLPVGFAVFSRFGGRPVAVIASVLLMVMPAVNFHAANARGYTLWFFLTICAWGISPGMQARVRWGRLTIAYFLLGTSHSLAFITLASFAFAGCLTGKVRHPAKVWLYNALAIIPCFLFLIVPLHSMIGYEQSIPRPSGWGILSSLGFAPMVIESFFGSSWFPGCGAAWALAAAIGFVVICRASLRTGAGIAIMSINIAVALLITGNPYGFDRCFMACLPFWICCVGYGIRATTRLLKTRWGINHRIWPILGMFLLAPWLPKTATAFLLPKQAYREAFFYYRGHFPDARVAFGISPEYATGLAFYGRQFGIRYAFVTSEQQARDSILSAQVPCGVIIPAEREVDQRMLSWVTRHMRREKVLPGVLLDTEVFGISKP